MTVLSGALFLSRAVLTEVVEDPNVTPRFIVCGTASGIGGGTGKPDSVQLDGEFRSYGNGNTRLILGSGSVRTQTLALRALTPSQVEVARQLQGHMICFRDTYGKRIFGAYKDITVQEIAFSGEVTEDTLLSDVSLVIQTLSYDERV